MRCSKTPSNTNNVILPHAADHGIAFRCLKTGSHTYPAYPAMQGTQPKGTSHLLRLISSRKIRGWHTVQILLNLGTRSQHPVSLGSLWLPILKRSERQIMQGGASCRGRSWVPERCRVHSGRSERHSASPNALGQIQTLLFTLQRASFMVNNTRTLQHQSHCNIQDKWLLSKPSSASCKLRGERTPCPVTHAQMPLHRTGACQRQQPRRFLKTLCPFCFPLNDYHALSIRIAREEATGEHKTDPDV